MRHKADCFPPIVAKAPEKLILGTAPGIRSLAEQQYYAHPQNGFWKIMGALYDMPVNTYAQRVALIRKNKLALWDVLSTCERHGSLDSNIDKDTVEVNDFNDFLAEYEQITKVFFNGATAEKEFQRRVFPQLPREITARLKMKRLPSTSPAHAGMPLAKKMKEWSAILCILLLFSPVNAYAANKQNTCAAKYADHASIIDCEVRQAKKVKAELDALMVKMEQNAQKFEAEMKESGETGYEELSSRVEDSQAAFEVYEKAQCGFEALMLGAGTAAADAKPLCEINLMQQRIKRLKGF